MSYSFSSCLYFYLFEVNNDEIEHCSNANDWFRTGVIWYLK